MAKETKLHTADSLHTLEAQSSKDDLHSIEADKEDFPEGGKGWLVIAGCVCASFANFGMINAYGAFETHYETVMFVNTASFKLSVIGSCQVSLMYFFAPFVVPLIYGLGVRLVVVLGGVLTVVAFFGLSTTQPGELWKCFLFQAVMFSIGCSLLFPPMLFSPIEWFKHKRAQALGIGMAGGSIGGIVWPILIKNMINKYGFAWTCRTIGFIYIPLAAGAAILIPQRIPEIYVHKEDTISNSTFNKQKLRQWPRRVYTMVKSWIPQIFELKYILLILACSLAFFGTFPAIFYIDYFATVIAPHSKVTAYILVIFNALGAPGRVLPALLSDKIGRLNTLILILCVSGAVIIGIWIPSAQHKLLAPFAVLVGIFGFTNGPVFALFPAAFTQLFGTQGSEARLGFFLFTVSFSPIIGILIAGTFISKDAGSTEQEILDGFIRMVAYSGSMLLGGALMVLIVRLMSRRKLFVFA